MDTSILFASYPWAFDCPGGGERQLMVWKSYLEFHCKCITVSLYDPWAPVLPSAKIFHFFSVMPGSDQLCVYMKRKGLKLVISTNIWVTRETANQYLHEEIRNLVNLADLLIVNSQQEMNTISEVYGVAHDRFSVVHNGVDERFFEPCDPTFFREQFSLGDRSFLLNIANVEPRKNQHSFLKALKHFPELSLIVIGNIRDESYFEKCRELGKNQFIYVGSLPYASTLLRSALAGAAGFVMPSTIETPSIAALEAAAAGCRVLVTHVGSTTEYFEDKVVYINPVDIDSMVTGIAELLHVSQPDLSSKIRGSFTWSHSTQKLLRAYQKIIS